MSVIFRGMEVNVGHSTVLFVLLFSSIMMNNDNNINNNGGSNLAGGGTAANSTPVWAGISARTQKS